MSRCLCTARGRGGGARGRGALGRDTATLEPARAIEVPPHKRSYPAPPPVLLCPVFFAPDAERSRATSSRPRASPPSFKRRGDVEAGFASVALPASFSSSC